jgi:orotate phosphoribosyltransferase
VRRRKGESWLAVTSFKADTYRLAIREFSALKDKQPELGAFMMAEAITKFISQVCPLCVPDAVAATAPRHSAFIGVPHMASLAARLIADSLGSKAIDAFCTRSASWKGHSPRREKEPPEVAGAIDGVRLLVVDDFTFSGSTMELHQKVAREAGATVMGIVWVADARVGLKDSDRLPEGRRKPNGLLSAAFAVGGDECDEHVAGFSDEPITVGVGGTGGAVGIATVKGRSEYLGL